MLELLLSYRMTDYWRWPIVNSLDLIQLKNSTPDTLRPRIDTPNYLVWKLSSSKKFTIRSTYNCLRRTRAEVPWHRLVWFPSTIPKATFILWLAIRKRLGTQDRLFLPSSNPSCLFCSTHIELHEHLFFECLVTSSIWEGVLLKCHSTYTSMPWEWKEG